VLSTSNRLSRGVDRVRVLALEAERLTTQPGEHARARSQLIFEQLSILTSRALILRTAITVLYVSIGLLVMTSIAIGVSAGLCGASTLLHGSLLFVREARLAAGSTL